MKTTTTFATVSLALCCNSDAYAGWTVTQLTNNSINDRDPQISGSNVVWVGTFPATRSEIFIWDGTSTTQLTNNNTYDRDPQISGSSVVWHGRDGSDSEIFLATFVIPEPATSALALALAALLLAMSRRRVRL